MNKSKGFTIIELIVVIAIIAVLASIVLVNVTSYIAKSKDAAIKGNMATILTNSAVYFDGTPAGTGETFIGTTGYTGPATAAAVANGGTALTSGDGNTTDAQKWCSCSPLVVTPADSFCVDSTGAKVVASTTACADECKTGEAEAYCH